MISEQMKAEGRKDAEYSRLEREANTFEWWGTDEDQWRERHKACQERRAQWGEDDCDGEHGSCAECTHDMAEALETAASRERRQKAREAMDAILAYKPEGHSNDH